METKKVYVVTSGEYSDYHIVGIFDSREKAEEYINHSTYSDLNDVEEYNHIFHILALILLKLPRM